jgi:hypothetical protein
MLHYINCSNNGPHSCIASASYLYGSRDKPLTKISLKNFFNEIDRELKAGLAVVRIIGCPDESLTRLDPQVKDCCCQIRAELIAHAVSLLQGRYAACIASEIQPWLLALSDKLKKMVLKDVSALAFDCGLPPSRQKTDLFICVTVSVLCV